MSTNFASLLIVLSLVACNQKINSPSNSSEELNTENSTYDFKVVFASCNDQNREQPLWLPILETNPDLFIWGGDNIYSDTDDMVKMKSDYDKLKSNPEYMKLANNYEIIGTWDDHDYGKNDGGVEWQKKDEAQQLFLDFLKIPADDPLRVQKGVYYSRKYKTNKGSIKVILLDTRYFRDSLRTSTIEGWRYDTWNENEGGTILGDTQWQWFENELSDTSAEFNIIVSSIQFLNDEHGYEKWGNHPSEVKKMHETLRNAKAKNIMILSGDRHMAEFSAVALPGLPYKLVDFTSSGLTHTYPDSPASPNRYRVGKEIKDLNFGVLSIDFDSRSIRMEIRGENNIVLETFENQY